MNREAKINRLLFPGVPLVLVVGVVGFAAMASYDSYQETIVQPAVAEPSPPESWQECMDDALAGYKPNSGSHHWIDYKRGVLDWDMKVCDRMFPEDGLP